MWRPYFWTQCKEHKVNFWYRIIQHNISLSNHLRFTASGEVIADIKGTQNVYLTMFKEFDVILHNRAVDQGAIAYLGDTVTKIQII
jgi:hypothetical protein